MKFLSVMLIALLTNAAFGASIDFYMEKEKVKTFDATELKTGALTVNDKTIQAEKSEIYNPSIKDTKTYQGYDFVALLDQVYGTKWREAKTIRFVDQDGWFYSASVKDLIKTTKDHPGYLAYSEVGKSTFTEYKVGKKMFNPGPFYLVFKNFERRGLASSSDNIKWTSQLKEVYVIK